MNQLINNQEITMCSRDISDLTGKRHDHVMADIKKMIEWLGDTCPDFSGELPDTYGRPQKVYFLPKRETLILVSGYSIDLRAKIIDRWQELELQQKPKLPQTYAEALLEAGRLALENEKQAEQLRLAAPKVEFVEKYIDSSTGSLGFRKVAKLLKVNEKEFRTFLSEEKIMYKLSGDWVPYQNHIDAGRFEVKAGLAEHEERSHAFTQSKFTAKGVEWVAGEYAKSLVRDATKV
jgi:phage antirepressor YoqD-like protein